jgi:heme O synthase-like polyprenyltransferase
MRTLTQARKLFLVSIIYLPLLFIAMALNKI